MSQRRKCGNPNFGRRENVPNLAANIFNPVANTPNLAAPTPATSTPLISLQTSPTIAITPNESSLETTPLEALITKDFGRDKNLNNLLKYLQPKAFTGEGHNIPVILEEWIMTMDDYFVLAKYNPVAQGIMGRAKLEGLAKIWWKLHC